MITPFDDYPVHQTSEPLVQPAPSDRNFYDRYWFNGFDEKGAFTFEFGFGQYPNRLVQDAHFTVAIDGVQHSFHVSGRAPLDRSRTVVGPLTVEVVRPLRIVRVCVDPNDTGVECDLTFTARTVPTQEPKNHMLDGTRLIMDTTRFTQFGRWHGWFTVDGERTEVSAEATLGTRDRSWGVRPVGESYGGAPSPPTQEPGIYWAWCPAHFADVCTQFGTFEDHQGHPTQLSAAIVPAYDTVDAIPDVEPDHREMLTARHQIDWERGTRRPRRATLELDAREGTTYRITLEPMVRCYLLGIGYQHPEWGHGIWKGELAVAAESWRLDDVDPLDYRYIHVHHICRATMTGDGRERTGVATLENLVFGRHLPSGFQEFLDGAS